ncbi:Dabb family protein [Streptomyces violaceusniger]|uniref:Stress responsive alpha-beta barrel domain-containing protein n=1 Tax=Streptomyces violaceusniger (strain Tu 4113) TaxID=653045 RepID=G2P6X4_STRV4|nr:Dabb family protein [Streptomyces violaceusniger]AEM86787.1 Stress responsive alpha-beta barrel domain-containing protein [Streptomyces violaceusniger Tu 4113]
MLYHINRATMKATATPEQIEAALESWREQGRSNPAIKSFIVGRDHGGDYEYSAVFVVEDLDGLFAYLTHPTTYQTDHLGLNLVERLEIFDVSDDDDPELDAKIQELHRRRNELAPEVAGMLADVPAYSGSGVND